MMATNHGLFGAVIAITLQRYPMIALTIAPFSHFLLDTLSHFGDESMNLHGKKFYKILFSDMTLAVVSTLVVVWVWQEILLVFCLSELLE